MPSDNKPMTVSINRAPVMTLWAAVVAKRLGFSREEAFTLGKAVAGLNAQSKGRALGMFITPARKSETARARRTLEPGETLHVEMLHRAVPVVRTREGLRAVHGGKPMSPESVERYLESKFKESLDPVRRAMEALAQSITPEDLAASAYALYEEFRPEIPAGKTGWGKAGVLDVGKIRALSVKRSRR